MVFHGQLPCKRIASLAAAFILLFFLQVNAHSIDLHPHRVCSDLTVGHGRHQPLSNHNLVSVKLVNSQTNQVEECYQPDTSYELSLQVDENSDKTIYGLLVILHGPSEYFGDFPPQVEIPKGLRTNLCYSQSFSHSCDVPDDISPEEYLERCNLGKSINLPYRSPSNRNEVIEFRYSIVFSYREFLQDLRVQYPACPPVEPCDQEDFKIPKNVTGELDDICRPNPRVDVDDERRYSELDVNYTCSLTYSKKTCATGCTIDNKKQCCGYVIKDRMKSREFTCKPDDPSRPTIKRSFKVPNPKGCMCFDCDTVCPAPGFSSGEENQHTEAVDDDDPLVSNAV